MQAQMALGRFADNLEHIDQRSGTGKEDRQEKEHRKELPGRHPRKHLRQSDKDQRRTGLRVKPEREYSRDHRKP